MPIRDQTGPVVEYERGSRMEWAEETLKHCIPPSVLPVPDIRCTAMSSAASLDVVYSYPSDTILAFLVVEADG